MNWDRVADSLLNRANHHIKEAEACNLLSVAREHHIILGAIFLTFAQALMDGSGSRR